jgi:hypothetical protein
LGSSLAKSSNLRYTQTRLAQTAPSALGLLSGSVLSSLERSIEGPEPSRSLAIRWSVPLDPYAEEQGEPVSLFGG